MNVIKNGYVLPLNEQPERYEEQNNRSARDNMKFVRNSVIELQHQGIVCFRDERPYCVSPLSIAEKIEPDGSKKLRLVWDGSRCINPILDKQKVTLAHFHRCLEITNKDEYQVVYDLKSAFHHIRISDRQVEYLGAAFETEEGKIQYFVFLYLPFGASSAVHCITKLFKPLNAYFHTKGIKHTIFIDDGRILARTAELAEEKRVFVYDTLRRAGWVVEPRKSDIRGGASQVKTYLGFVIDTTSMTVRLPTEKKNSIKTFIKGIIGTETRNIHIKDLAKTLGKIIATEPALGNLPILTARAGYAQIEEVAEATGWNSMVRLSDETLEGLSFFLDNMDQFDNTPIRTSATEVSVVSIIGPPDQFIKTGFVANHVPTENSKIWASDASGFATCAYSIKGEDMYFRGLLTKEEKGLGSGHLELLAVRHTLEYYTENNSFFGQPCNVYWLTDSENLVRFLTKGSRKRHIQKEIFQTISMCQKLGIRIIPIHLRREDPRIQLADTGSKIVDTDDWEVNLHTFKTFSMEMMFTIDLFATKENTNCKRFYSNFYSEGTNGIDAFCHSWDGETAWICPPINQVYRTIRRIRKSKMSGLLYVPDWQTADFLSEIFNSQGKLQWPFTSFTRSRPFLIQKEFSFKSPFRGNIKFDFLALKFVV
jgi:hypothetical protein